MMKLDFSNLRGDIFGGVTAGIVALPLALALGVASGAGPVAGLYGAIAVGFFASLFGGTNTQISGPTGPMVVVFAGLFAGFSGRVDLVFTAVILAGLFQILFGVFRMGDYIRLVPYPVVSGFMSGIGVIIISLQIARLLGHSAPASPVEALLEVPAAIASPELAAALIGFLTLGVVFLWPAKLGKYIPGPLGALIVGTIAALFMGGVPKLGDIPSGLPDLHLPVFAMAGSDLFMVVEAALLLAILGAIDSLLTSLVADNMTRTRHQSNKELFGQGLGNMVAGFLGGVAGAGATMRTVVNIRAGGRTRLSGAIHSVLLLAVALGLGPLAAHIPHAALAAILIKVGFDIIDWTYVRRAHKGPRWDLFLMVLVLALTVFVDLMTAVAAGVVLAALAFVQQAAQEQLKAFRMNELTPATPAEAALLAELEEKVLVFEFAGPLSFGAAADLGHHARERVNDGVHSILLDFSNLKTLDTSAARAVETICCDARRAGKHVYMSGLNGAVGDVISGLNADHCLPENSKYLTKQAALEHIKASLLEKSEADTDSDAEGRGKKTLQPVE